MMRYYIYIPLNVDRNSVTIYDSEEEAERVAKDYRNNGLEAYVCEFGYPFA